MYMDARFEPPLTQDVVTEFSKNLPPQEKGDARQIIADLTKDGTLVKLSNDYYIHKVYFDKAVDATNKFFETNEKMQMKDLRDMLATSRKYAILIIDCMDRKKITAMRGDYRIKL